jgi:dihydroneopterin aldolase
MGLMEVNGIRVFAHHGCLPEEARIGGHYRVDVRVEGDFGNAERSDDLSDAVDYARVAGIVREAMTRRSNLIEHVAHRILEELRAAWPGLRWRVRVVKEHPPVEGDVREAVYTTEG